MRQDKIEDFEEKYVSSSFAVKFLIRNFYRSVEKMLANRDFENVLEVGCGTGFSTEFLAKIFKNKNFEASDLLPDLVKAAKERNPGIKISQESIYELKRRDNSFDLVVASEVLEHLDNPELALKELSRVTSKYCLVSCPQEPLWRILNVCRLKYLKDWGNTPGHINHWSKKQFQQFLRGYFKIEKITTSLPWIIALTKKR